MWSNDEFFRLESPRFEKLRIHRIDFYQLLPVFLFRAKLRFFATWTFKCSALCGDGQQAKLRLVKKDSNLYDRILLSSCYVGEFPNQPHCPTSPPGLFEMKKTGRSSEKQRLSKEKSQGRNKKMSSRITTFCFKNTTAAWAEGVLFPPYKGRGSNAMSFAANLTKIVAGGQGLLFCITIWVSKIWFSNFVRTRISGFLSIFNIISYHSLKDIWIRFVFFSDEG